jgi:hypothetical protein
LVKRQKFHDPVGEPLYDTWTVQNDSALPVRILTVQYYGGDTHNHPDGPWRDMTDELDERRGVYLRLDDEVPEMGRLDARRPWSRVVVPPGDTMTAGVPNLTDLRIKYRRAGFFGFTERREVRIRGGM